MELTNLTPEEMNLVSKMEEFGATMNNDFFVVLKENLDVFIKTNRNAYDKASKLVPPTEKQLWMVNKIIDQGVSYENNVFRYMHDAYNFIGKHFHLIKNIPKPQNQVPPSEWGGVLNH